MPMVGRCCAVGYGLFGCVHTLNAKDLNRVRKR